MATEHRSSLLPPAQPSYIFRGHTAHIHSVQIVHQNTRLLTGDADGWIVYWKFESKRPVAVWRAHDAAILGTAEWGCDKVITHGRDNALRIWQLRATDEPNLSSVLPADRSTVHRPKPWLLHSLPVNTLNFCAFSMCHKRPAVNILRDENMALGQEDASSARSSDTILVAVPARDDRKIEVYQFPDEKLASVVPRVQPQDTGMVMTVKITHHKTSKRVMVIAGYEGGFTAVHLLGLNSQSRPQATRPSGPTLAQTIYLSQPHNQPVLSLDASPDAKTYFTSSADAVVTAHRLPELPLNIDHEESTSNVADALNPALSIPIVVEPPSLQPPLSTAKQAAPPAKAAHQTRQRNWSQFSIPSSSTLETSSQVPASSDLAEPTEESPANSASLVTLPKKSINTSSSTTPSPLTFPKQTQNSTSSSYSQGTGAKASGLSSLLSSAPPQSKAKPVAPTVSSLTIQTPFKTVQTKHAGQQSLRVRSDGRLLVTGGWDSRIRIYSTKTLTEVAVLKWHKEGVYAAGFSEILDSFSLAKADQASQDDDEKSTKDASSQSAELTRQDVRVSGLGKLQRQREEQMQMKHWVVAGAKDGKVSLWEVY